jgi:hypothetical protein
MEQHKYNEFDVQVDNGRIVQKMPTLRKSVMIYDHDAERNNSVFRQTKLWYELVDDEKPKETVKEPIVTIVAKIDLPQPIDGVKLLEGLTGEKFIAFTDEQVDAVLPLMSKVSMLKLVDIEIEKNKLALIKLAKVIEIVKEKRNELKK